MLQDKELKIAFPTTSTGMSFAVVSEGEYVRVVPSKWMLQIIEYNITQINEKLGNRRKDLLLLNELTKNVDNLRIPRITFWNDGDSDNISQLLVEKASGVEIGTVKDDPDKILSFLKITTAQKVEALKIFLRCKIEVNKQGKVLGDENLEGLFISVDDDVVTLWKVDPDGISYSEKDIVECGGISEIEMSPELNDSIKGFFSGNITNGETMIPDKIIHIAEKVRTRQYQNVESILLDVEKISDSDLETADEARAMCV